MNDSQDSPPSPESSADDERNLAPVAAMIEAFLGVVALALGWWSGVEPGASLDVDARSFGQRVAAIAWGLAATLPPLVGLRWTLRSRRPAFVELRELVDRQVAPWFARSALWELAILALAAGFGEEMLFRGLLQTTATNWLPPGAWAIVVGIGASSLLFGACHSLNRTYFVLATGMSVYLGLLYVATDDLTAPIITHAAYDFVALVWLTKRGALSATPRGGG